MASAENKEIYKCAICNKEYTSILERANCEQQCSKELEIKKQKALLEKEKKEQEERKIELDNAFKYAFELHDKYIKKYNYYDFEFNGKKVSHFVDTAPFVSNGFLDWFF